MTLVIKRLNKQNNLNKMMALISCSECGHDISKRAKTCPQCGAPQRHFLKSLWEWNNWGIYYLLMCGGASVFVYSVYNILFVSEASIILHIILALLSIIWLWLLKKAVYLN